MRTVAQLAFSALRESGARDYETVVKVIDDWINAKGNVRDSGSRVVYHDGREALLEVHIVQCQPGHAKSWKLSEPTAEGRFMTDLSIASAHDLSHDLLGYLY